MMTPFSLGQPLAPDFVRNFISLNDSEYATEYIEFHYTASPAGRTVGLQRKPSDTASTAMYHLYLLQAVLSVTPPITNRTALPMAHVRASKRRSTWRVPELYGVTLKFSLKSSLSQY